MIDFAFALPQLNILIFILSVLFFAGLIQGVFGLGFAMIATPTLSLLLDYRVAVVLAAVPLWFLASRFIFEERALVRSSKVSRKLVPGILVGSTLGVVLYGLLPSDAYYALLGALLLLSALVPYFLRHMAWINSETGIRGGHPFGFLAGVTESLMNVGAPFVLLFSGISNLNRPQQLLALNLCFAIGKTVQLGLITLFIPVAVPTVQIIFGVIFSSIGFRLGQRFSGTWSEALFRRTLFIFLLFMASAMLAKSVGLF